MPRRRPAKHVYTDAETAHFRALLEDYAVVQTPSRADVYLAGMRRRYPELDAAYGEAKPMLAPTAPAELKRWCRETGCVGVEYGE